MSKRIQSRPVASAKKRGVSAKRKPARSKLGNSRARRRSLWEERYVLSADLKTSRIERQQRREAGARTALKTGAVLIFFIFLVAGVRSVFDRALRQGNGVVLQQLDVRSDGSLHREKILQTARVAEGDNLLDLDLDSVKERLEALPQVASASVMRRMPGRLVILLEERKPLAWLSCPAAGVLSHTAGGGYLLDTRGNVFRCEAVLREYVTLPVIHVQEPGVIRNGARAEGAELLAAIRLLQLHLETLSPEGWYAREVEILGSFKLRTRYYNDAVVTFGRAGLERQVTDLARIARHAAKIEKSVETVNLIPERNVPVTYFDFQGRDLQQVRRVFQPAGPALAPAAPHPGSPTGGKAAPTPAALGGLSSERTRQIRGILGDD